MHVLDLEFLLTKRDLLLWLLKTTLVKQSQFNSFTFKVCCWLENNVANPNWSWLRRLHRGEKETLFLSPSGSPFFCSLLICLLHPSVFILYIIFACLDPCDSQTEETLRKALNVTLLNATEVMCPPLSVALSPPHPTLLSFCLWISPCLPSHLNHRCLGDHVRQIRDYLTTKKKVGFNKDE